MGVTPDSSKIEVTIDIQLINGEWSWPKISVVGCSTEAQYELVTATYAELGAQLLRAARSRQQHWKPAKQARQRLSGRQEADSFGHGWMQLSLVEVSWDGPARPPLALPGEAGAERESSLKPYGPYGS